MEMDVQKISALADSPTYNIKAVVQKTGVQTSTLRAWERRYGIPRPERSAYGHRLYSERDVAIIAWLWRQVEVGVAISQAVALLRAETNQGESEQAARPDSIEEWQAHLLGAILHFNVRQAHTIVNHLVTWCPVEELVLNLFRPTLAELGQRWFQGNGTIAEEHFGSHFIRHRLLGMLQTHAATGVGPRVVCACPAEETHELGLLMFSLLIQDQGYEVFYLGQRTPCAGFADCVMQIQPQAVCMTAALMEHVPALMEMGHVVEGLPLARAPLFLYSGAAFTHGMVPHARVPGSYLGDDLEGGVGRLSSLLGSIPSDGRRPNRAHVVRPAHWPSGSVRLVPPRDLDQDQPSA